MVHRFTTRVELHGKTATFFHVPPEVMEALGPKKRVPVRVTVNGHTYRSTVAPMGGNFLLPLNRENRAAAEVASGEVVEVALARDKEPRVVEVPDDLTVALAGDEVARNAFGRLSYSHQREFVGWITEAKRNETRARRVTQTLTRLRDGKAAR